MKKNLAISLREKASEVAHVFSNPHREYNPNSEIFEVEKIDALSESVAGVTFLKSTGKRALAYFFFVKNDWRYYFPTDSHILGMQAFAELKKKIEVSNFQENFKDDLN